MLRGNGAEGARKACATMSKVITVFCSEKQTCGSAFQLHTKPTEEEVAGRDQSFRYCSFLARVSGIYRTLVGTDKTICANGSGI